jgi:predicted enzyme related to lactoylglutathione lyase
MSDANSQLEYRDESTGYYVEINSPDHVRTARFFSTAFGWDPQPFATPDYLVSPGGETGGVHPTGVIFGLHEYDAG